MNRKPEDLHWSGNVTVTTRGKVVAGWHFSFCESLTCLLFLPF
ncbi:MAG: hypothetical protein ACP5UA_13920 [Candidatus Hydrogenedens sp.]